MNIATTLQAVINTLNRIPVSGAENLDGMLGCIQVLEQLKHDIENAAKDEVSEQ